MKLLHGVTTASASVTSASAQRRHPFGICSFSSCSPFSITTRPPIIVNSVPVYGIEIQFSFEKNV